MNTIIDEIKYSVVKLYSSPLFGTGGHDISSINIHNLDSDIERQVKQLAKNKQQSLSKTIKEIIEEKFEKPASIVNSRKRFEKFCGIWDEQEYKAFSTATEDFSRVD